MRLLTGMLQARAYERAAEMGSPTARRQLQSRATPKPWECETHPQQNNNTAASRPNNQQGMKGGSSATHSNAPIRQVPLMPGALQPNTAVGSCRMRAQVGRTNIAPQKLR